MALKIEGLKTQKKTTKFYKFQFPKTQKDPYMFFLLFLKFKSNL
jgi:hypothetical protein